MCLSRVSRFGFLICGNDGESQALFGQRDISMQVSDLKCDGQKGEATILFSSDDPIFRGHFDYQPIVPGVALMEAVVQIVSQVRGNVLRLKRASNVKFFQVVQPGQLIHLKFDWSEQRGFVKVQARLDFSPEQKIAALSCELVEEAT